MRAAICVQSSLGFIISSLCRLLAAGEKGGGSQDPVYLLQLSKQLWRKGGLFLLFKQLLVAISTAGTSLITANSTLCEREL